MLARFFQPNQYKGQPVSNKTNQSWMNTPQKAVASVSETQIPERNWRAPRLNLCRVISTVQVELRLSGARILDLSKSFNCFINATSQRPACGIVTRWQLPMLHRAGTVALARYRNASVSANTPSEMITATENTVIFKASLAWIRLIDPDILFCPT